MKSDYDVMLEGVAGILEIYSKDPALSFRRRALNDKIGEYTIDTVDTPDMGYETGICKNEDAGGNWIIVEYYENEESARIGHAKWCEFAKDSPASAYSAQLEREVRF